MDDQYRICGAETSGTATVAFVNVAEEWKNVCRLWQGKGVGRILLL